MSDNDKAEKTARALAFAPLVIMIGVLVLVVGGILVLVLR